MERLEEVQRLQEIPCSRALDGKERREMNENNKSCASALVLCRYK